MLIHFIKFSNIRDLTNTTSLGRINIRKAHIVVLWASNLMVYFDALKADKMVWGNLHYSNKRSDKQQSHHTNLHLQNKVRNVMNFDCTLCKFYAIGYRLIDCRREKWEWKQSKKEWIWKTICPLVSGFEQNETW